MIYCIKYFFQINRNFPSKFFIVQLFIYLINNLDDGMLRGMLLSETNHTACAVDRMLCLLTKLISLLYIIFA